MLRFENRRNNASKKVDRQFTTEVTRIKPKRLYPVIEYSLVKIYLTNSQLNHSPTLNSITPNSITPNSQLPTQSLPMRILILEDEEIAARRLERLIREINPEAEILGQVDSIEEAVRWFGNNPMPDLIFMDIHLADGPVFDLFAFVEIDRPVIFTTAYDQYALQAFKVNAIDYLLKPLKREELVQAIVKYRRQYGQPLPDYGQLAETMKKEGDDKRFLIRFGQTIKVVTFREAAYFYTEDKVTFIVTKAGKRYPLDYSLEKLEEMADPGSFFRINRQFIVHREAIHSMFPATKSRVRLALDPPCEHETVVSTERSPVFKKWVAGG